jgi:hypothetical protein
LKRCLGSLVQRRAMRTRIVAKGSRRSRR